MHVSPFSGPGAQQLYSDPAGQMLAAQSFRQRPDYWRNFGPVYGSYLYLYSGATINANAVAAPAAITGTLQQWAAADGVNGVLLSDVFAATAVFIGRRANNTAANPSAVTSGNGLAQFAARGYGATAYSGSVAAVSLQAAGTFTDASQPTQILLQVTAVGATTASTAVTIGSDKGLTGAGAVKSSSATGGIGYAAGAGGTVAQATSKATGVTLNTPTGQITMNAAALAANTTVSFTLTNSTIGADDVVAVNRKSGGTAAAYQAWCDSTAAGSCVICVRNTTAGSLSEAVVLQFSVIKAVTA